MEEILSNPLLMILLLCWILPWKGVALWKAARNAHKKWFIALLILNTMAFLEIIYIFYFSRRERDTNQSQL
ncbi:MAG TPA: hypothetical protein ENL33_00060 [Candidatus Parcubacteria bacterium]|nr:hypothetical protein [Candidatus Parcubacteria bacterium]